MSLRNERHFLLEKDPNLRIILLSLATEIRQYYMLRLCSLTNTRPWYHFPVCRDEPPRGRENTRHSGITSPYVGTLRLQK